MDSQVSSDKQSECKSLQVHARSGQTESQVDPSLQLASTCDSGPFGQGFSLRLVFHKICFAFNMYCNFTLTLNGSEIKLYQIIWNFSNS